MVTGMRMAGWTLGMTALLLGGCLGLGGKPDAGRVGQLPVVAYGATLPKGDYVLHFTAGQEVPVDLEINGTLLAEAGRGGTRVRMARDLWVYHKWISYDGQHWIHGDQGVEVKINIDLPRWDYSGPGRVALTVNAVEGH
ncbi:MAG: hypothetical protein H7831_11795 [Magnetococcus sp. WYHC-3]